MAKTIIVDNYPAIRVSYAEVYDILKRSLEFEDSVIVNIANKILNNSTNIILGLRKPMRGSMILNWTQAWFLENYIFELENDYE